jgi:hypothetical protein
MDAFWERLSSDQIVAVIAIVVSGIVAITMILGIVKYQLHSLADDTALRRERQEAELLLRTKIIEHASKTGANLDEFLAKGLPLPDPEQRERTSSTDADVDAQLAKRFGMLELPSEEIECTLALTLALEPAQKRTVVDALDEMIDLGADPKPILATVRALCNSYKARAKEPPAATVS